MKTKNPILFLLLFLPLASITAGGLSEEIYTSFKAGPAYEIEEEICFLTAYRLYRAPRGLRRFPDGGQSRTVFQSTYILTLKEGLPVVWKELPGVPVTNSQIVSKSRELLGQTGTLHEDFDINYTNRLIRRIGPVTAGFPSPLLYSSKKTQPLIEDIIRLEGDLPYRQAIIRQYVPTARMAEKILKQMDEYKEKLDGADLAGYNIYSDDTRRVLESISLPEKGDIP